MICNLTNAMIILPSRHRLEPGANPNVPTSVLELPKNGSFVAALWSRNSIAVSDELPPPKAPPENVSSLTRRDLARMQPSDVYSLAIHLGVDPRDEVDTVRVAIARELFS